MKNLSIYLPPFAGDYSGACSALYDPNCLLVLCDAACCTKNYINYEEPRWAPDKRTALSAQLRTVQVAMGDDDRIIDQSIEAAISCGVKLIVLLGSPVPALTGMDMSGMARRIERLSGIPAIGLNTTGFSDYTSGVEQALLALIKKFAGPQDQTIPNGINLLGATPIDLGSTGNETCMEQAFAAQGYEVICDLAYGYGLEDVRRMASAGQNVVVTASGLEAARYMEKTFGIPYRMGMPVGADGVRRIMVSEDGSQTDAARLNTQRSVCPEPAFCAAESEETKKSMKAEPAGGLLLVGDQVIMHSIREALRAKGFAGRTDIAGFFKMDRALMCAGDRRLRGERDLIDLLTAEDYQAIVGDPLLCRIPQVKRRSFFDLPHPAVSGPFGWEQVPLYASAAFDAFLERILTELSKDGV